MTTTLTREWAGTDVHAREQVLPFLRSLRETILQTFSAIEPNASFVRKPWTHAGGGGGEIAQLRGSVFEKAAVNFSAVEGSRLPLEERLGPYFATGISLITHMANPHAPTVHMNLRYFETAEKSWLGGGYDLTPMGFPYPEDTEHFHSVARNSLAPFGPTLYQQFSENARDYFFIPHRQKERGIGGLFFDSYNTGDFDADFSLWKAVGENFLEAILPIYERRTMQAFTPEDRQKQLVLRGHYVEFNLVYDRGTRFGFRSGGNPEAILSSLPPSASW